MYKEIEMKLQFSENVVAEQKIQLEESQGRNTLMSPATSNELEESQ